MMKKKKRAAAQASIEQEVAETTLRKSYFLRATQSDRITILVGPSQTSFKVPQDLLMLWSPPLGEMCRAGLGESQTRSILLPHIKAPTFEDFLIWIYNYEPSVDQKNLASVLDLAIFAEMYLIYQLKNQTSDILRTELSSGRWQLTPVDVSMIYDEVPSGSILRQLCSASLVIPASDPVFSFGLEHPSSFGSSAKVASTHRQHKNYLEWKPVFEAHSDLGWDYFGHVQTGHTKTASNWGGACRFHDHRDISDVRGGDFDKCPYPRGALPTERHTRSLPNEYQREVSVGGNNVEQEARPLLEEPQPTLEETAEEEAQPTRETYAFIEEPPVVEDVPQPTTEEPQPEQEASFWG